ncbi:MAG: hypothetical protein NVV83_08275 [Afipia sp.]|nr:hypothetical protein [Afipia sp.]
MATFEILPKVLHTGTSNNVMMSVRKTPRTKNFEGQYGQDGTVHHLNIALGVHTLLAYHGLVALVGSGARAKDELRALEVGIGDIDYRLGNGREHLTNRTAFESEDELERAAFRKYAALQADGEAATDVREKILATTESVRLVFRAYQRAQGVLDAERKGVGKSADDSAAQQERAYTHTSSHLSATEAFQVAYLADINSAELWIQYAAFFGRTFELARFVGRVNAGVAAMLSPDLFELTKEVLAAESQETDLSVLWVSLRQLLNRNLSTAKFDFALRIAEMVDGTIHVTRETREQRNHQLTIEERNGTRYAIVEKQDLALMVVALDDRPPVNN